MIPLNLIHGIAQMCTKIDKAHAAAFAALFGLARRAALTLMLIATAQVNAMGKHGDTLPSWATGETRERIISFVERTTNPAAPEFVPIAERIAVFDNDGTLWAEKPVYFQLLFAVDSANEQLKANPSLAEQSPWRELTQGGLSALAAQGEEALLPLVTATHGNQTEQEFAAAVQHWLDTARHPTRDRAYTQMIYQPMLELLEYLREHDYQVWIVSGGGQSFMRVWTESVYGIPPERVIGSVIGVQYTNDGAPALLRGDSFTHINDKGGKPVGILHNIGRRPIIAVGNSDGDFEMLEWTTRGHGARLGILIHHTDAKREWAYDRDSHVGRLDKALDKAAAMEWLRVDMQRDWRQVFSTVDE